MCQSWPLRSSFALRATPRNQNAAAKAMFWFLKAAFMWLGRCSSLFFRSLAWASSMTRNGKKPSLAATIAPRKSTIDVPLVFTATSRSFLRLALLPTLSSRRSVSCSANGSNIRFASSCAEASAPVHARFTRSINCRAFASSAASLPLSVRCTSVISTTRVRSAARATEMSSTSVSISSATSRPLVLFTASQASCTFMNRPSAGNSEMSSASLKATRSSNSNCVLL
mmetsp:Transcript_75783/g.212441  ORF Transcript_75783/g.212441 Transcript_75783/m.212441 type:complete len:226 (-) Transcript_75783:494-1171(-)